MQGMHLRKYGVEATIPFELYEVDGVDFRVDAVHATGDSTRVKDGGAEQNTSNGFVDEGKGYSITLTAGEMQAAEIVIYIVDQTATKVWLDKTIIVETYGHAAAMHAMDFDDAVRGGMTALPNVAANGVGGLVTGDGSVVFTAGVGNRPAVDVEALEGVVATLGALADQYDGTGLLGDPFPLRQDQGASISGGLSVRSNMTSVTAIQGSEQDLANTNASNDTRWTGDDDGAGAEFLFRCTPADNTAAPGELHFEGYYDEPSGSSNGATLSVYNFQSATWDVHVLMTNSGSDETHEFSLAHENGAPGSGTLETVAYTIGDVLIKFEQDTQETGNACLLIDRMYVGFISAAVTAQEIREEIDSNSTQLILIVADTNELQTDWENGGRLDLIQDIIAADTTTDIPALIADVPTVTEFNARTILAAAYFDPAADAVTTDAASRTASKADVSALALEATVDAVKADTAAILLDTGTAGVVVAAGSKTGYKLASDGVDLVVIETGMNLRQAMTVNTAALVGILSGAATTTITILGAGVATTRIVATVDADGNRSALTLTLPA